jgi:hypothetical protein
VCSSKGLGSIPLGINFGGLVHLEPELNVFYLVQTMSNNLMLPNHGNVYDSVKIVGMTFVDKIVLYGIIWQHACRAGLYLSVTCFSGTLNRFGLG